MSTFGECVAKRERKVYRNKYEYDSAMKKDSEKGVFNELKRMNNNIEKIISILKRGE